MEHAAKTRPRPIPSWTIKGTATSSLSLSLFCVAAPENRRNETGIPDTDEDLDAVHKQRPSG